MPDAAESSPWRARFPHPFFIGRLVVQHRGCWASEFSRAFNFLVMYIFIYKYYETGIDVYAILKPKNGQFFTLDQIRRIYNSININPFIEVTHDDVITNRMLILRLRINDYAGSRFVIRRIRVFGLTPFEIGLRVENGFEYLYGLFPSEQNYEDCKTVLKISYGEGFQEDLSVLATSPGLQLDPPLFGETVLCNILEFETYRRLLDDWIINGVEFAPDDWTWNVLEYINQVTQRLQIDTETLEETRTTRPPENTREKLKRLFARVTEAAIVHALAYWLKLSVRFLVNHYFMIDIGDP